MYSDSAIDTIVPSRPNPAARMSWIRTFVPWVVDWFWIVVAACVMALPMSTAYDSKVGKP
jgi:hypothetical protein